MGDFLLKYVKERSAVHGVTIENYVSNMNEFLSLLPKIHKNDIIHLYFGDDAVCKSNSELLITYFKDKVDTIFFHLMNEYKGIELSVKIINH